MQVPAENVSSSSASFWRACAQWFLFPALVVSAFPPYLAFFSNIPRTVSLPGFLMVVDVFCRGFVLFGVYAGLLSLALYLLTFWAGPLWRSAVITAAICFVIFGNLLACVATSHDDRERGVILPELTKQEIAERGREYWDALLVLGGTSAVIGALGALGFAGVNRWIDKRTGVR